MLAAAIVLTAALAIGLALPSAAYALTPGQPLSLGFPRVATWWPTGQKVEDMAKYDYVALMNEDFDRAKIPTLRSLNPDIILFADGNACELSYKPGDPAYNARRLSVIPGSWVLTQVGSTLASPLSATSTTLQVREASKSGMTLFAAGDLLVIENEYALVTGVNGTTITVQRGVARAAASHGAGVRVASAATGWPNTVKLDIRTSCPQAVSDPAVGLETAAQWKVRRQAEDYAMAQFDGILIDLMGGNMADGTGTSVWRSVDPDRSNTVLSDYAAFNADWNAGMTAYQQGLRNRLGEAVILGNDALPNYSLINGADFEDFPRDGDSSSWWHERTFGPSTYATRGSYLDWMANGRQPNLTTVQTYEHSDWMQTNEFGTPGWHPNYQKMRFGLTTALLGDGFYSYEMASNGHGGAGLMWFDEYDNAGAGGHGYLGKPSGAPRLAMPAPSTADLVAGTGAFDTATQLATWRLSADSGYAASRELDGAAARINVAASSGGEAHVRFSHTVSVKASTTYTISFRAKSSVPMTDMYIRMMNSGSPYALLGNTDYVATATDWHDYELQIRCSGADANAELTFALGKKTGSLWIDDLKVQAGSRANVYRRDFENGVAICNGSDTPATVPLGETLVKIKGTQDTAVNDGRTVTEVTLAPRDGIVLLRPAVPVTPPTEPTAPTPTDPTPVPSDPATPVPTVPVTPPSDPAPAPIEPTPTPAPVPSDPATPVPTVPVTPPSDPAPAPVEPTPTTTPVPSDPATPAPSAPATTTPTEPAAPVPSVPVTTAPSDPATPAPVVPTAPTPSDPATTTFDPSLPSQPPATDLVANAGSRVVALTWKVGPARTSGAFTQVQRRTNSGGWSTAAKLTPQTTAYSDTSVANRHVYYYRVVVVDNNGIPGVYSNQVSAYPSTPIKRYSGADRVATAIAASGSSFATSTANTVVMASGASYPDALSAAGLAGAVRGPVLLVSPAGITADILGELTRLGAKRVLVVGGRGVVPNSVLTALQRNGLGIRRIAGADRYATAAAVAMRIAVETGSAPTEVFVTTGRGFADALSVSPFAYTRSAPVLLTTRDALPKSTLNALKALAPAKAYVVGGTGAVSRRVESALQRRGIATIRVSGADRYATARSVCRLAISQGWADSQIVYVVTGANYPDALGAGPAAGNRGGLLLLAGDQPVRSGTAIESQAADDAWDVDELVVVGGKRAISDRAVVALDGSL